MLPFPAEFSVTPDFSGSASSAPPGIFTCSQAPALYAFLHICPFKTWLEWGRRSSNVSSVSKLHNTLPERLKVRVVQGLIHRKPARGVEHQKPLQQVYGMLRRTRKQLGVRLLRNQANQVRVEPSGVGFVKRVKLRTS